MLHKGCVSQVYPQLCLLIILRESLVIQATLKPMISLPQSSKWLGLQDYTNKPGLYCYLCCNYLWTSKVYTFISSSITFHFYLLLGFLYMIKNLTYHIIKKVPVFCSVV